MVVIKNFKASFYFYGNGFKEGYNLSTYNISMATVHKIQPYQYNAKVWDYK